MFGMRRRDLVALFGGREFAALPFLDQRTNPKGLLPARQMPRNTVDQFRQALFGDDPRFNWRSSGRHFVDRRYVHFAIAGKRKTARDRGCRHHQKMRNALPLARKHQPLAYAKTMLLIDYGECQRLVSNRLLKNRVRADKDVDRAIGQTH